MLLQKFDSILVNRAVLKSVGKKDEMQVEETQYPLAKFYIM